MTSINCLNDGHEFLSRHIKKTLVAHQNQPFKLLDLKSQCRYQVFLLANAQHLLFFVFFTS